MNHSIEDPQRLEALKRLQLLDSDAEEAFDRLGRLVQRLLGAPVALVSLVDRDRQFFKSAVGLEGPIAASRQTPLTHSFCQHVITTGEALIVNDAPQHPLVRSNPAIRDLGIQSYLGFPVCTPDGFIVGSFCAIDTKPRLWSDHDIETMRELTDLVISQIALREALRAKQLADQRLQKIAGQVPGVIYQYRLRADGTSHFPYASEGIRYIYRVSPAEAASDAGKVFSALHPEDLAGISESIQHSAKTLTRWRHEYRTRFEDGIEQWLLGDAIPEREADGGTIWYGYITEITARKHTEMRLRGAVEQIGRQQYAIDQHAIVAMTDLKGTITYANENFSAISGYTNAELIGANHRLIKSGAHAKEFFTELYQTISQGKVWHGEICNRAKDGHLYWEETTIVPFFDMQGKVERYVAIRTDVTTQKEAADERLRIDRKLAESAKLESLGVLAGGIAHDFNNLLTVILGNASLLRFSTQPGSASLVSVDHIEQASRRAADLCKQMLAYSGRGRFVVEEASINGIIEETTRMLEISVSKHCVLRFHLAGGLPLMEADATQIRQIVMNLVINASEAIGGRSGVIAVTTGMARVDPDYLKTFIHVSESTMSGDYVFLEVSDTGCGMTASTVEKIFDPFFTTKFTGRGLGLAALLGIVRAHKGAIKVYSEPDKGTTFKILFPVIAARAPTISQGGVQENAVWQGSGTVLVVDDEEAVRVVAAQIIELMSFNVELASDGRQAVQIFAANPSKYTLVLLDLTMPHMDGEETYRQLRLICPDVRVLMTSGFNRQEVMTRFAGKGVSGFIQKPFEASAMVEAVKEAVLQGSS